MSRSPGNYSSDQPLSAERESDLLRAAVDDSGIQRLFSVLGNDSGLALVGGSVRELLSQQAATDFDLAIRLHPDRVKSLLEQVGIRVIETGIEHGTVLAVLDHKHYEITTYRVPGPRVGNRYSETLETDLSGRDFTINAIAYDLASQRFVDPFLGAEDLKKGILRCVGSAEERFKEDPLRILRAVRFGPASGRTIHSETEKAAILLHDLLSSISIERIRNEFEKILMSSHPAQGLRALARMQLLPQTIPELQQTIGVEQNDYHVHDVFEHTLSVIENSPADRILRLTALFHDLGKPATLSIGDDGQRHFYLHEKVSTTICHDVMKRMRYSQSDIDTVSLLVATHMRPLSCGPQGVRRLMRDLGPHLESWFQFKFADRPPRGDPGEFEAGVAHFTALLDAEKNRVVGSVYSSLAISGEDVLKSGVAEGPAIGKILKSLNDEVLDDPEKNTRDYLLNRLELIKSSFDQDR